jgi:hypothetical protein
MVQNRLQEVVAKANDAKLPRAPDGGGYMLSDQAHTDSSSDLVLHKTEEQSLKDELRTLGMQKERSRWGKGVGLRGSKAGGLEWEGGTWQEQDNEDLE